jgi:hypothetical protein
MAKIIDFYIPLNFRKTQKTAVQARGQVIEFARPGKKSA